MNNDEVKKLLRELKESSDSKGEVRSRTVHIEFDQPEKSGFRFGRKKKSGSSPKQKQDERDQGWEDDDFAVDEAKRKGVLSAHDAAGRSERAETEVLPDEVPDKVHSDIHEETQEEQSGETPEGKQKQAGIRVQNLRSGLRGIGRAADKKKKPVKAKKTARHKETGASRSFKRSLELRIELLKEDLEEKGITGKEILMIVCGLVIVLFLVAVVVSMLSVKTKSEHVTADAGLTVTVESEPDTWCDQAAVELGIRADKQIQGITVNGESCAFDTGKRSTYVTVETNSGQLEVTVQCEEAEYHARVEIPYIDSENPMISVKQENGMVTLNAVDSRSGLDGVYYGTTNRLSDVPIYELYTGPFAYEQGKMYYYYAQDAAGNRTAPEVTNMLPAEELIFAETQKQLFQGESFALKASTVPEYSYCNNFKLENMNPDIVELASDGTVTAIAEGEAVIVAKADGLQDARCTITVQNEVSVTLSLAGDCTLGSDISFGTANSFDAYYNMYGSSYFFQNVKDIFQNDDLTFVNLEGTLTTLDTRENKQYAFKGLPEYTQILTDGSVEAVSLANNHSADYGAQSLEDTKQNLSEAGIGYCTGDQIDFRDVNGVKAALISIYVLNEGMGKAEQVKSTIASAKAQGADIIVTAFHWGTEKSDVPDETQISLAHLAVDNGASLVVGHHPHVLQGIEQYNGVTIAYSLANFCFGGNSTPSDLDTVILQETFTVDQEGSIQSTDLKLIPCSVSSEYGWNNYQPTPAEGTEAERIMQKINDRSSQFGQTYGM